ncbi:hypothetical protein FXF51_06485 [Nonomuraea sp. PA05]|uniref:hypothetical protein n=1 Tax=Nonomuraea sp. PA05 TaxID=2604466 RepID=UPI0011DAB656|nr:hypothetical protein [Nonomuraea sp. PA05]TYB69807.1 hypothetical protein FXF51_06485 [Nonomuraea sp. PA05]
MSHDPLAGDSGSSPAQPEDDPRDEPAPFAAVVLLTVAAAAGVMVLGALAPSALNLKFLLFGPIALVVFEIAVHEVWWKRWWGAIPGAVLGLAAYFEGRAALADIVGDGWAHPVAYVTAWALFAAVFAWASRYPRTSA